MKAAATDEFALDIGPVGIVAREVRAEEVGVLVRGRGLAEAVRGEYLFSGLGGSEFDLFLETLVDGEGDEGCGRKQNKAPQPEASLGGWRRGLGQQFIPFPILICLPGKMTTHLVYYSGM